MDIENLIEMNVTSFSLDSGYEAVSNIRNSYIGYMFLKLLMAYFEKLVAEDITIDFPDMRIFVDCQLPKAEQNIIAVSEQISETIFFAFCSWAPSFKVEVIDIESLGDLGQQRACFIQRKRDSYDNLNIRLNSILNARQRRLFCGFPEILFNALESLLDERVIYLSNSKLVQYLEFAQNNQQIIKNQFLKEHYQIKRMMHQLRKPLKKHKLKERYYKKQYIIGLCIERVSTSHSHKENLNWDFLVALYLLEKLLELANGFFGFYNEEE